MVYKINQVVLLFSGQAQFFQFADQFGFFFHECLKSLFSIYFFIKLSLV